MREQVTVQLLPSQQKPASTIKVSRCHRLAHDLGYDTGLCPIEATNSQRVRVLSAVPSCIESRFNAGGWTGADHGTDCCSRDDIRGFDFLGGSHVACRSPRKSMLAGNAIICGWLSVSAFDSQYILRACEAGGLTERADASGRWALSTGSTRKMHKPDSSSTLRSVDSNLIMVTCATSHHNCAHTACGNGCEARAVMDVKPRVKQLLNGCVVPCTWHCHKGGRRLSCGTCSRCPS